MEKKGNEFKGLAGGKSHKNFARLFGFTTVFYRKGIGNATLADSMKALDLGYAPVTLSFALAKKVCSQAEITGIDISEDHLNYVRNQWVPDKGDKTDAVDGKHTAFHSVEISTKRMCCAVFI
jgi:2-polyprenyl-3-methyl-5-hydroxy-6-metoxy-1,4-benzoquinol methylase